MSKRDEDADMEVGMTTAERRRRRRRGAGLRVPSDNVPRRAPTAPPVAPVPEDPSLAMSIAYSFTNDASGPVPRTTPERYDSGAIVAPEASPTVIDPPNGPIESEDFEMKTREMSAVDLKALGIDDPNASSTTKMEAQRASDPKLKAPSSASGVAVRFKDDRAVTDRPSDVDVEVTIDTDADKSGPRVTQPSIPAIPATRLKTVALTDEDLEDVRSHTQPIAPVGDGKAATPASARSSSSSVPPPMPAGHRTGSMKVPEIKVPSEVKPPEVKEVNRTQELQALDIEVLNREEPLSVPEIDINELADRASESGEIEVDVDEATEAKGTDSKALEAQAQKAREIKAPPGPVARQTTIPPVEPATPRTTTPPPTKPSDATQATGAHATAPTPPPTPHKAPPTPPPKKAPPVAAVAAAVAKSEVSKPTRGKPWFIDLFDEDYLRTLPFLTSQATQSEAEFVIEAMGLTPGAQVLDVGCGYGRHAMELAARGYHVVGLDLSTPLLVRGGEEAHRRGLTINFVRGDMRELDFENQFDAAYCLFSTFGYFDDETNKKALINIARALKTGGKVLIEILNRDYIIADLPTRVWWEGEGCVVLEEVELNYFSSRIQVQRSVVFDDGRQLEQEISVRAYSLHEVGKLMHAAGFRVLEVSGGYQTRGRFFGNQSRHIIVLAERKETSGSGTGP